MTQAYLPQKNNRNKETGLSFIHYAFIYYYLPRSFSTWVEGEGENKKTHQRENKEAKNGTKPRRKGQKNSRKRQPLS